MGFAAAVRPAPARITRPAHPGNHRAEASPAATKDTPTLAQFLSRNAEALLPMLELIEQSQLAVDELIDVLGRASIEAVLQLSAQGIAGPPHPGQRGGAIGWTLLPG